jgi:5-hydroxyisourate hydrolase-like protein (transthyretin family)
MLKKRNNTMRNKLTAFVILLLTLVLASSFASADLTDGIVAYYKLDETSGTTASNSVSSSYTGTANNARVFTSEVAGIINTGADFTQGNDIIDFGANSLGQITTSNSGTISAWSKGGTSGYTNTIMSKRKDTSNYHGFFLVSNDGVTGKPAVHWTNSGGTSFSIHAIDSSTTNWEHYVITFNNGVLYFYRNGVYQGTTTISGSTDSNLKLIFGAQRPTGDFGNNLVDEVGIWNRSLTSDEVEDLYNAQKDGFPSGQYPTFGESTEFKINARDSINLSLINTFNATINGTLYQTTNGTIVTPFLTNETEFLNISVEANNYFSYLNSTYNTSEGSLVAFLEPFPLEDFDLLTPSNTLTNATLFNITWTEAVSPTNKSVNYTIEIFDTNLNSSLANFTTSNLYYEWNTTTFDASTYNISVSARETPVNNIVTESSLLYLDKTNYLYFRNEQTTNPIENGNVTITRPFGNILQLQTDSEGKVTFNSFVGTTLQTGNYTIRFEDFTGFVTPITFHRNYSTLPQNETFDITVTNINLSIFYRTNSSVFNLPATIIIEGLLNTTTSTGNLFLQNQTIVAGTYTARVLSQGFWTEQKAFVYTSQENVNLNFYLLEVNNSNSATITVRVLDDFQRLVANAEVTLLQYDESSLSYKEVAQAFTDSNGEVKFLIEVNAKTYKINARRELNGAVYTASSGESGITFQNEYLEGESIALPQQIITLNLRFQDLFQVATLGSLQYTITESFNSTTNVSRISTTFTNTDGTSLEVCHQYFEIQGTRQTLLPSTQLCVTGSSGIVNDQGGILINRSKNYMATITANGVLLQSYRYNSVNSLENILKQNFIANPFILLIYILVIGVGLYSANLPLTGILLIMASIVQAILFPTAGIIGFSVLQILLALNLIFNGRKKQDFE